jgi:glycerol-3-phosphate dehydrogenase subunit B
MMSLVTRVLVIGGGIAGAMAAIAAVQNGAETTLVTRAPGATALYAGGMEIAAELKEMRALAAGQPYHPFVRLGLNDFEVVTLLDEVCYRVQSALGRAGLKVTGGWRTTGWYADIHGAVRPAHLVPASVHPGELTALQGKRVLVIGISAVGDYDAVATAAALADVGVLARPLTLAIDLPPVASLTDLVGLPAPEIKEAVEAIAFPPGLAQLPENGFELLATVPSPHGWRLLQALDAALADHGVEAMQGEVTGARVSGSRVEAALTSRGELIADQFVLATGRYIGGGLVKERVVREPVFDLGVFHDGRRVDREWPERLRHLEFLSPHPAFKTGLLTDNQLRPLTWEGFVGYDNLRAAGSVLGGYDYIRGYGFGVPLLTGWLAGRWAATA